MVYISIYLIFINLLAFALMGIDKKRARNGQYRISEQTLWIVAIAGGAVGATIGMNHFRHKTKHTAFKYGFPFLAAIESGIILYFAGLYL